MKHNLIGDIYQHKKTGGLYGFMGMALLESTHETVVIYRNLESQRVWVRPATEFFDGRFEFKSLIELEDEQGWM